MFGHPGDDFFRVAAFFRKCLHSLKMSFLQKTKGGNSPLLVLYNSFFPQGNPVFVADNEGIEQFNADDGSGFLEAFRNGDVFG